MPRESVWCVGMMRDEADVARHVVEHLAAEAVDGILVADNRSQDGTWAILHATAEELDVPLVIVRDTDPGYYQAHKMSFLARLAVERGATWIVPFDADEIWTSDEHHLGPFLRRQPANVSVVEAQLFNHFATALDTDDPNPFRSMEWRQPEPGALPKVAIRWQDGALIHQGNHGVDLPERRDTVGGLQIRHFPYRSFEHFVRKARNGLEAYRATDLPKDMGAHWRQYGELLERFGEATVRKDVWERYFWFFAPIDGGLIRDPAPFLRWAE